MSWNPHPSIRFWVLLTYLIGLLFPLTSAQVVYNVTFTGQPSSPEVTTPKHIGINFSQGNDGSNSFIWLKYLNPTATRLFVTTINDWKSFINARQAVYGSQWGRSFQNESVTTEAAYIKAVNYLRQVKDIDNFLLYQHPAVRWISYIKTLNTTNNSSELLKYGGNPKNVIANLSAMNLTPMVVWHVTCANHHLTTSDPSNQEFHKERLELYRWFYLAGRFLSKAGVKDVELYNEPNTDTCLTNETWVDNFLIRGQALQDAYADVGMAVNLMGPPLSMPTIDSSFAAPALLNRFRNFPSGTSALPKLAEYTYHQYNAPGYGMKSAFNKTKFQVAALNNNEKLPMRITEFNCYSGSKADTVQGVDVMDLPSTAACLAGQVVDLIGGPEQIYAFKFTQTGRTSPAGVAKNGLFFADIKAAPYDVGGSTKAAEAYRMILRATPGQKRVWNMTFAPKLPLLGLTRMYTVGHGQNYAIFVTNGDNTTANINFNLTALPGIPPLAPVVINTVSNSKHGEVSSIASMTSRSNFQFVAPAGSVHMLVIPRVPVYTLNLTTTSDATLYAGVRQTRYYGASTALTVGTSTSTIHDTTAVSVLKFDTSGVELTKITSAVLRLRISSATNVSPQILTVLGVHGSSIHDAITWSGVSFLKPLDNNIGYVNGSIATNFINWMDPNAPSIVGHLTVPIGTAATNRMLQLDVTEYVKSGKTGFMLTRLYRYEQRGTGIDQLPGDDINGKVLFYSKENTKSASYSPSLRVYYS